MAELRRRAKFGQNRSNRGRVWRFFYFPRWRPSAVLDSLCVCSDHTHKGHLTVFIAVQNLVGIDAVILIICMFFDFTNLA